MARSADNERSDEADLTRVASFMLAPDRSDESWRGLELSNAPAGSLVDPALLGVRPRANDAHSGYWASSLDFTPLRADERPQSAVSSIEPTIRRAWPPADEHGEEDVLEDLDALMHSSAELTGKIGDVRPAWALTALTLRSAALPRPSAWTDPPPLPALPNIKVPQQRR